MDNNANSFGTCVSSTHSLISFMEHSQHHWFMKDKESRYIYMNDSALSYMHCPKGYDVAGKLEEEVLLPSSQEFWSDFVELDKRTIEENKTITNIEVHYYGDGNIDTPVPHICNRTPLYDAEHNCIGIVCHGVPMDSPTLLYYMHRFNRSTIQFDAPNNTFTQKELEIAFWAQQKLSAKEIAKRLDVSHRTIENRLQTMYQKAGVHTMSQFIEYCYTIGLDKYIPSNFIRKGVQLLS